MDNEPRKEGLRRAQKILVRLRVKIHHPSPGAAPVNWPTSLTPRAPFPRPFPDLSNPIPARPPAPACCRENRESGLRRARQPLGMLGGGTGSAAGRARPPSPRAAAAPAATAAAPRPRTPLGAARAIFSGTS